MVSQPTAAKIAIDDDADQVRGTHVSHYSDNSMPTGAGVGYSVWVRESTVKV